MPGGCGFLRWLHHPHSHRRLLFVCGRQSVNEKGMATYSIIFSHHRLQSYSLIGYSSAETCRGRWYTVVISVILFLGMIVASVFMDSGERSIPIQYAKRQVGRKMYGGQNTHLPIKVAMTGVMPIIFTYAIVGIPATIAQFVPKSGFAGWVEAYFSSRSAIYIILTFVLIIAFNYFYIAIQYNLWKLRTTSRTTAGLSPVSDRASPLPTSSSRPSTE